VLRPAAGDLLLRPRLRLVRALRLWQDGRGRGVKRRLRVGGVVGGVQHLDGEQLDQLAEVLPELLLPDLPHPLRSAPPPSPPSSALDPNPIAVSEEVGVRASRKDNGVLNITCHFRFTGKDAGQSATIDARIPNTNATGPQNRFTGQVGLMLGRVSCHDIAGIWVAFFQERQQYRCGQAANTSAPVFLPESPANGTTYIYHERGAALGACKSAGYAGLCSKSRLEGHSSW